MNGAVELFAMTAICAVAGLGSWAICGRRVLTTQDTTLFGSFWACVIAAPVFLVAGCLCLPGVIEAAPSQEGCSVEQSSTCDQ